MRGVGDGVLGGGLTLGGVQVAQLDAAGVAVAGPLVEDRVTLPGVAVDGVLVGLLVLAALAQLSDLMLETTGARGGEQLGDCLGVIVNYVDKPDCQSCGLAECPQRRFPSWW